MEHGIVSGNRVMVRVRVLDADGIYVDFDAVMDTGFSGFMTLPSQAIQSLKLSWINRTYVYLAGYRPAEVDVFAATVLWHGEPIEIEVIEMDDDPLVGMAQLRGNEVRIEVNEGGLVQIEPL